MTVIPTRSGGGGSVGLDAITARLAQLEREVAQLRAFLAGVGAGLVALGTCGERPVQAEDGVPVEVVEERVGENR